MDRSDSTLKKKRQRLRVSWLTWSSRDVLVTSKALGRLNDGNANLKRAKWMHIWRHSSLTSNRIGISSDLQTSGLRSWNGNFEQIRWLKLFPHHARVSESFSQQPCKMLSHTLWPSCCRNAALSTACKTWKIRLRGRGGSECHLECLHCVHDCHRSSEWNSVPRGGCLPALRWILKCVPLYAQTRLERSKQLVDK